MPCDPACRGPLEPSKPWGQVAAPGLGRSRRQQLTGSKSQSGEMRRLRARRRMAKTANLTSCMFCHNKRFQSSIFLNKSKDKISAGMARAGTRDRGPEPRAPFQSEAGGRVCPFLAVGGGGRPQGSGPRGCRDAGASHTRRQAAECGRRSPGLPHTLERPGSARRLPARAAPARAATAPAHSALETPRPAASPGWQVPHTPCPSPPGDQFPRPPAVTRGARLGHRRGRQSPGPPSKHRPGE